LKTAGFNRRTLLRRLIIVGAGVAGYLVVREQMVWPTPRVTFAGGDRSGWIDLPLSGGLIDMAARVGGTVVRAVVDSGAQYSAVDAGLAQKLALPAATPLPMVAFGVSGGPSLTRAVTLEADLGAFAVKGLRAATLDLQPLSGLTRQPFSLLLGRDFLRAVTAEVDFPRGRVAFFAPNAWTPPAGARLAPARSEAGGLMVPIRIENAPQVEVMLDTGATGALALAEKAARAAGLMDGRPLSSGQSVTLGGVSQDGMAIAREVLFAGHRIPDVEVQIYRPAANAPVPDGLLGLGVLQRFHLALDLAGGRLFLIGAEQPPARAVGPRTMRFDLVPPPKGTR
jgi:predicted aspartyl protease